MPDELSPEDRAAAQLLLSKARQRDGMRPILEERQCLQWNIPYDEAAPDNHRAELEKRYAFQRAGFDAYGRHVRFLGFAGRAAGAAGQTGGRKIMDWIVGAGILYFAHLLAKKLGINVAGMIP